MPRPFWPAKGATVKRTSRRTLNASLLAIAVAVFAPGVAHAATVGLSGSNIEYGALAGEANQVTVTYAAGSFTITENGAGVPLNDGDGAGGCSVAANVATCPGIDATGQVIDGFDADLGDLGDTANASALGTDVQLSGGSGDDNLTGG